jgi:hypothetical protein
MVFLGGPFSTKIQPKHSKFDVTPLFSVTYVTFLNQNDTKISKCYWFQFSH